MHKRLTIDDIKLIEENFLINLKKSNPVTSPRLTTTNRETEEPITSTHFTERELLHKNSARNSKQIYNQQNNININNNANNNNTRKS